jgi:DNA repair protein RadC
MESIKEYRLSRVKTNFEKIQIIGSRAASEYARKFYFDDLTIYESCFIMLMNTRLSVIGYAKISQGGITGTIVDPILVAKYAIESLSKGVILCHNHPSGGTTPSAHDHKLTETIKNALGLFSIRLLDHIILTEDSYYSFSDEGII